ncbi:PIR protein [Plasmodium vivax]|nr:PIR protein [Plasmodium vivax]
MAESQLDHVYLTYDNYSAFKDKFSRNQPFSSSEIKLEQLVDETNFEIPKNAKLYKTINNLLRHINDNHYFYWGENLEACKYIRYILQKEVEVNLNHNYDTNIFKNFQNFLIKYGEIFPHKKGRCTSKIEPIDETTFKKMHALHQLYDKYEKYKVYAKGYMNLACDEFNLFIKEYNIYINDNESKSEAFNRILKNLSEKVENTASDFREQCKIKNYRYDLSSPKLHKPTPEIRIETPIHTIERQTELSSAGDKSQRSSHETLDISHPQLHQEVTESPSNPKETLRAETHEENDNHRGISHNHVMHNNTREINGVPKILPGYELPREEFDSLSRLSYPVHQKYLQPQELSNEPARESSTILGSITGALKDVDPVPVVGVSGGMGALFLLFRYTPVGAFFRGGRGRAHRIPRSFNGPFRGGFPGYEEYDGGYIGYSQMNPLAE